MTHDDPIRPSSGADLARLRLARKLCRNGLGRSLRERADLQLNEVANVVGVGSQTLLRWEAGDSRPGTRNALAWLDALTAAGALDATDPAGSAP